MNVQISASLNMLSRDIWQLFGEEGQVDSPGLLEPFTEDVGETDLSFPALLSRIGSVPQKPKVLQDEGEAFSRYQEIMSNHPYPLANISGRGTKTVFSTPHHDCAPPPSGTVTCTGHVRNNRSFGNAGNHLLDLRQTRLA